MLFFIPLIKGEWIYCSQKPLRCKRELFWKESCKLDDCTTEEEICEYEITSSLKSWAYSIGVQGGS